MQKASAEQLGYGKALLDVARGRVSPDLARHLIKALTPVAGLHDVTELMRQAREAKTRRERRTHRRQAARLMLAQRGGQPHPGRSGIMPWDQPTHLWCEMLDHWPTAAEWLAWQKRTKCRILKRMGPDRRLYQGPPARPWVVPDEGGYFVSTRRVRRLP